MTIAAAPARTPLVVLAGNPNTGKTTLFNRLTGSRAKVGNYPGITVEQFEGSLRLPGGGSARVLDVPGAYSLSARSAEEQVALRTVIGRPPYERPDLVVVVVDATQLTRNLYLVLQLVELDLPVVVALTMTDMLREEGKRIDELALARALGVPVVPVVGTKGIGVQQLAREIERTLGDATIGRPGWRWVPDDPILLADVQAVESVVPESWYAGDERRRRALALWALLSIDEEDELEDVPPELRDRALSRHRLAAAAGREIERDVIAGRYGWIDERAPLFVHQSGPTPQSLTDRIDRVLLHPWIGFALFLALMTVVFQSLFTWADPVIGLVEAAIGALGDGLRAVLPAGILTALLTDGVVEGVGAVVVFLPQILLLFLFIGIMEDTGYMARVAFLMDRIMKSIGLHGRAFVPMLSGYACAIPAILATRTMERRRDRMLTMMVVPLMTCSARLPVYGLLIAALYPPDADAPFAQGLLLAAMYLFSTVVALACAAVLGRTVFKGPKVPLLLEMPPYRMPHWPSVLRMMGQKSWTFVREAGTVILVCTVAMWALLTFPREPALEGDYAARRTAAEAALAGAELETALAALDSEEQGERLQQSLGGRMGRALEPALEPLGFDWQIGVGIVGAFAAREVFVSTMAVVYGLSEDTDESSTPLREQLRAQRRPDGTRVYTPLTCLSLMVFFALACQCMSTLAVLKRETGGWAWPAFAFAYMGVLAWLASFAVVQGGRLLGFT